MGDETRVKCVTFVNKKIASATYSEGPQTESQAFHTYEFWSVNLENSVIAGFVQCCQNSTLPQHKVYAYAMAFHTSKVQRNPVAVSQHCLQARATNYSSLMQLQCTKQHV